MRIFSLVAIAALTFVGCGSDGLGFPTDGGTVDLAKATHDLATGTHDFAGGGADDFAVTSPPDLSSGPDFGGVSCGSSTCGAGSVCCVQASQQMVSAT